MNAAVEAVLTKLPLVGEEMAIAGAARSTVKLTCC